MQLHLGMLGDCRSYIRHEVCEVLSRYLGPFLLSRLLRFGLTDATLCWNEIGLWVYSGNTQVHNGEVKMMEEKVMVCEEPCPHYN